MWPEYRGRDGCRTPMPWDSAAPDLGFGSGAARPWLPIAESHRALAVDRQDADPDSLLNHYRRLLRWRRGHRALVGGTIGMLPEHDQVLGYVRSDGDERLLCAFNLSDRPAALALDPGLRIDRVLDDSGASGARSEGRTLHFDPYGVLFARLA